MKLLPVFLPLLSFFICIFFNRLLNHKILAYISSLIIFLATGLSVFLILDVINAANGFEIYLFKWLHSGQLLSSWTLSIDFLSAIMILVVNVISSFVQIYSIDYMKKDTSIARFFCYLNLFTFFMLILVSSGNLLQLFFGWEGVGLCSYLLIGFWYQKESACNAALKAFIINRVGDMFFLLGIILIYLVFDSITFTEIFPQVKNFTGIYYEFLFVKIDVITFICILLLLGAMGKSAQLGLHTWLPDAMEGPIPVSALIHAATMVTAGVFLVCKMSIFFNNSIFISNFIILLGALTAIFAATVAIAQNDIKKIIAYSTCSQLGFMFIAAGFSLYNLAIFHLTTHAFFKALLFLGAGSIIHSLDNEQNIKKMGNLYKKLPVTYIIMIVGSLALCGIPYFSGYYSKELIVNSGLASNLFLSKFVYLISVIVVFLTSLYSFRLIFYVFHGKNNLPKYKYLKTKESSFTLLLPLIILSLFAIFSGYLFKDYFISEKFSQLWLNANVANLFLSKTFHHEKLYYFLPSFFALLGIFIVFYLYIYKKDSIFFLKKKFVFYYNFVSNKFYFDELYDYLFVRNIIKLSENFWKTIDIGLIDRLGPNGVAYLTKKISNFFSKFQTGYIYHYAFSFIAGITLLISLIIFFLLK